MRVRLLREMLLDGRTHQHNAVITVDSDTAQAWVLDGTAVLVDGARGRENTMLERFEKRDE